MLKKYIITDATGFLASHPENTLIYEQFSKDGFLLLSRMGDGSSDYDVEKLGMWVSAEEVHSFMTCIDEETLDTVWLVTSVELEAEQVVTKVVQVCASEGTAEDIARNINGTTSVVAHKILY